MQVRGICSAVCLSAAIVFGGGCAGEAPVSEATIAAAVRTVGFPCGDGATAERLGEDGESYRVACGATQAYVASVENDNEICIEPLIFDDSVVPGVGQTPRRCTALQ